MQITRRSFLEDSMLAAVAAASAIAFLPPVWAEEKQPGKPKQPHPRSRAWVPDSRKQHAQELGRIRDCEIAYVCRCWDLGEGMSSKARLNRMS